MQINSQYHIGYPAKIIIEDGIFLKLPRVIRRDKELTRASKYLFVIDKNFQLRHQRLLTSVFRNLKLDYAVAVVDAGIVIKSLAGAKMLYQLFCRHNLKRDSVAVAIGGGTLCDAVGFAAATYMRGIRMINIPTTMMSCADPVMGKVAINHFSQKNLIGTWFFPHLTLIDPILIKKDVPRYFNTGIAEIIKSALVDGKDSFNNLKRDMNELVAGNDEMIKKYIEMSVRVKTKFVKGDERDINGQHVKLSLGHALADVIESAASAKTVTHGEAVALGMIFAACVNNILERTKRSKELFTRIIQLIRLANLPTKIPFSLTAEQVIEGLLKSKKSHNNTVTLVLIKDYGKVKIMTAIKSATIKKAYKAL